MSAPTPRTIFEAVPRRRFLISGWPWRSAGYLLSTAVPLASAAVPLALAALPWALAARLAGGDRPPAGTIVVLVALGTLLLAVAAPLVAVPLADLERRRLRLVDARPVTSGHRPPAAGGAPSWLRTRYGEAATWREAGYVCLLALLTPVLYGAVLVVALLVCGFAAAPLLARDGPVALGWATVGTPGDAVPYAVAGVVLLPALPYLLALLAGAQAAVARALLGPGPDGRLRAELVEVSRSRARLVDAFEAERRRIERDLHDGAQQRLLSLTLRLGLARLEIPPDSPAAAGVDAAHEEAKRLMVELRELVRGIHPRVLTDRGLPAALGELADRSPMPVTVRADLPGRPPGHVEGTAYFVVAEALTNVVRHSGASAATVTVRQEGGVLAVEVGDDGAGGADPRRGSGLTGLADRVAVIGGRLLLSSPPGGPTLLRVELPCSENEPPSG